MFTFVDNDEEQNIFQGDSLKLNWTFNSIQTKVKRNKNKCYIRESIDEELRNRIFNSVRVDLVNQPFCFERKLCLNYLEK